MSLAEQLGAIMGDSSRLTDRAMDRHGLTLAKVTNISDPDNLNRVKCLPIDADDSEETDWCYVMAPMGGPERGLFFFPQVDDLVVLGWLEGDTHRPLVLGAYWNTETAPPLAVKDGKSEDYLVRTPNQIDLLLHDTDGEQAVTLTMPSGTVLVVDDKAQQVCVRDKDDKNSILLDWKGGAITIKAEKKVTVSAGETTLTMESGGNITLKGKGTATTDAQNIELKAKSNIKSTANSNFQAKGNAKVAMEGGQMELKATGKMAAQGAMTEVKATGQLTLQASGIANLKGAMVKIN